MNFVSEYREKELVSTKFTSRVGGRARLIDRIQNHDEELKKTRLFSYEFVDESDQQTGEEVFRREFFYCLMDATFTSLQERFNEIHAFKSAFGFLCWLKCT